MTEEEKKEQGEISRREFLKDAGFVVGGAAIGAGITYPLVPKEGAAEATVTKTVEVPGPTKTTTKTVEVPGPTKTVEVPGATKTVEVDKFKCPVCGSEFNTYAELQAHYAAAFPEETLPELTKLTINGKQYEVQIEPQWTLQRTLLYKLGMYGSAHKSCDHGACGSCTVIIDGRPVLGCMTLAIECEGKNIETIDGITAAKHPLLDSYYNNDVGDCGCGYCMPGIITTAKVLLEKNPNPTEEEVKQALAGNICRCSSYYRHPKAVLEAAQALRGGG